MQNRFSYRLIHNFFPLDNQTEKLIFSINNFFLFPQPTFVASANIFLSFSECIQWMTIFHHIHWHCLIQATTPVDYYYEVKVAQSCLTLGNQWTVACLAPLSMEFTRQESWSGLSLPSPGDLPNSGIEPWSPALQTDSLLSESPGKPFNYYHHLLLLLLLW